MENTPNYYAIIPANVRYCKELPAAAKLLYGEISALSNKEGYCFATNKYFSELYEVSDRSIQIWITKLEQLGFIYVDIEQNNSGTYRKLYLADAYIGKKFHPGAKKISPPGMKKISPRGEKNFTPKEYYNNNTTQDNNKKEYIEQSSNELKVNGDDFLNGYQVKFEPVYATFETKEKISGKKEKYPAGFPPELIPHVDDFIQYRKEIKKPYRSDKSLTVKINQLFEQYKTFGLEAVIDSIQTAIAQGYQGTFIDKKYQKQPKPAKVVLTASEQDLRDELAMLKTKAHNKRIDFSHITGTISEQIAQLKKILNL